MAATTLTVTLWLIGIPLILIGVAGTVLPALPGVFFVFLGILLTAWIDEGHDDDGRDIAIIDTRNDFEVQVGHFHGAINPRITKFTELPAALEAHRPQLAGKRIVTYCTGGIRCEKAALWMAANGYDNVVQLDGGVLDYFEHTGGKHWDGELFVFDRRVSLTTNLAPGTWEQDFDTRTVHPAPKHDTASQPPSQGS